MTLLSLYCCLFGHEDIRERRGLSYVLQCERCGQERPMLETEVIRGPKHQPDPVLGKPLTTTFRESPFGKRKIG